MFGYVLGVYDMEKHEVDIMTGAGDRAGGRSYGFSPMSRLADAHPAPILRCIRIRESHRSPDEARSEHYSSILGRSHTIPTAKMPREGAVAAGAPPILPHATSASLVF